MKNEIWESELEALRAIYADDFSVIIGPWNSISCSLRLEPRGEKADHDESVLLTWKVPPGYPKTIPTFSVTQSNIILADLTDKVENLALKFKGTEMIYDIANFIQDELVPAPQSFYDSMVNRAEQEKKSSEEKRAKSEKELEYLKFEKVALLEEKVNQDIKAKKSLLQVVTKSELQKIVFSSELPSGGNAVSRYLSDFEELEFLGKGGFGSVIKVKNRVDGQMYAIKKIKLDPNDIEASKVILREVQALSRLFHQYVVRYYQSWFETYEHDSKKDLNSESESDYESDNSSVESHSYDWLQSTQDSSRYLEISFRSLSPKNIPVSNRNRKMILYIQMEYCENKTLWDVIQGGLVESECWRLLHQILEGLDHIHKVGLIHRDLKPTNIFLDRDGNVKIGDFGLVTVKDDFSPVPDTAGPIENSNELSSLRTIEIGTPVYAAPEIASGKTYSAKVDIYSLGICFFEMCYQMSTGMQRAVTLKELRDSITFPQDFDIVNCEKQYKIIKWLLDHNPFNRPTCAELIKSPLVPVIIEEQFLNEAIKSITTISNYPKLIASLFSRKPESHKDFSYDFNANNSQLDMQFSLIGTRIQEHCLKVFTRHGAVQLSAPLLMLKNDFIYDTETSKRPVQLMDSTGDLVQLPWDLTVPFARCISRAFQNSNHLETFKRFAIDPVYRPNIAGGQPKRILECDFDIVSRIPADRMAEAEVIKTTFEVLDIDSKIMNINNFELRITHTNILYNILKQCGVPRHKLILSTLENLNKPLSFAEIRTQLGKHGVSKNSLDILAKFNFESKPMEQGIEQLKTLLPCADLNDEIQELTTLTMFLHHLGIKSRISLIPLLSYNLDYYKGGMIFQIVHGQKKKLDVVAAGGRYDSLLSNFQYPGTTSKIYGVGVNIALSKIISKWSIKSKSVSEASGLFKPLLSVLISAHASDIMSDKLKLLNDLWLSDIPCQLSTNESLVNESYKIHLEVYLATQSGYNFLVIFKSGKDSVKIKNLFTKTETEVLKSDVVSFLKKKSI